jgi:hypothetical protein
MVTSKKPVATDPVDQFISLIKTSDKKETTAQKTVAKGSAEKKAEKKSEKKALASTSIAKGTKTAKPLANKKESGKKTADTEPAAKKTESPPTDRPTSPWPFPSSGSKS